LLYTEEGLIIEEPEGVERYEEQVLATLFSFRSFCRTEKGFNISRERGEGWWL